MVYSANGLPGPKGPARDSRTPARVAVTRSGDGGNVPRAPWRRRRTTDSPRPAGRRWAGRLRRSGSLARQVLLVGRPGRRRSESGQTVSGATLILPERRDPDAQGPGPTRLRRRVSAAPVTPVSSVALAPTAPTEPAALHVPLLPGDQTLARRTRFVLVNACTVSSLMLGVS